MPDCVDRVGGVRHQRGIAGVDEAERGVGDALLGSDQRDDFVGGIEADLEALPHPVGDRAAQFGQPLGFGVAVVGGHVDVVVQRFEDVRMGGQVGVADAEGDDADALFALLGDTAADLDEQVGREILHPLGGADH